jgi:hypothetical protein
MKAHERIEWVIAYALAFVSAATASLYGFMSAAGPYGYVKGAGLFGVAFIGCHGPAWIVKAKHRLGWSGAVFGSFVTAVCLGATLWGGLGTNATGGATLQAERTSVADARKDDRAELARIMQERAAMPAFSPTIEEAVQAASAAVIAAEAIRLRECGNGDPKQRGPNCRQRETEEQTKRDALAAILVARAATDRVTKLDGEAAAIRARLGKSLPVIERDPQASAFSQLTGISIATSAALNAFWLSLAFELGAMFAMMLAYSNATTMPVEHAAIVAVEQPTSLTDPVAAEPEIAALARETTGDVRRFMLACLPRAADKEATWGAIYARYQRWCADQSPPAVAHDLNAFGELFGAACERARIRTQKRGSKLYCVGVQLVA